MMLERGKGVGDYPMAWHSMTLDFPSLTTYHMKYFVPDRGILEIVHI